MVKKVFSTFLLIGLLIPTITDAGVSPEGNPNRPRDHFPEGRPRKRKPRCKGSGGVTVCRMPKPKKCTKKIIKYQTLLNFSIILLNYKILL